MLRLVFLLCVTCHAINPLVSRCTAGNFAVLSKTGISIGSATTTTFPNANQGVGLATLSGIIGTTSTGIDTHIGDATAQLAFSDACRLKDALAALPCTNTWSSGIAFVVGSISSPIQGGVHCFSTTATYVLLTNTLHLDFAANNPIVIRTALGTQMILDSSFGLSITNDPNNVAPCQVFWESGADMKIMGETASSSAIQSVVGTFVSCGLAFVSTNVQLVGQMISVGNMAQIDADASIDDSDCLGASEGSDCTTTLVTSAQSCSPPSSSGSSSIVASSSSSGVAALSSSSGGTSVFEPMVSLCSAMPFALLSGSLLTVTGTVSFPSSNLVGVNYQSITEPTGGSLQSADLHLYDDVVFSGVANATNALEAFLALDCDFVAATPAGNIYPPQTPINYPGVWCFTDQTITLNNPITLDFTNGDTYVLRFAGTVFINDNIVITASSSAQSWQKDGCSTYWVIQGGLYVGSNVQMLGSILSADTAQIGSGFALSGQLVGLSQGITMPDATIDNRCIPQFDGYFAGTNCSWNRHAVSSSSTGGSGSATGFSSSSTGPSSSTGTVTGTGTAIVSPLSGLSSTWRNSVIAAAAVAAGCTIGIVLLVYFLRM